MGHIPVGMELFQAGNEDQWTYIKSRIVDCDYYTVIVAERYGSRGSDGKSYTEMEYDFAIQNGIPVSAFLLEETARGKLSVDRVEMAARAEIDQFREICKKKMVRFWKDTADLPMKVMPSLMELFRINPRPGWIRGDHAMNPDIVNQLNDLVKDNQSLRSENEVLKRTQVNHSSEAAIEQMLNFLRTTSFEGLLQSLQPGLYASLKTPGTQMNLRKSLFSFFAVNGETFVSGVTADQTVELLNNFLEIDQRNIKWRESIAFCAALLNRLAVAGFLEASQIAKQDSSVLNDLRTRILVFYKYSELGLTILRRAIDLPSAFGFPPASNN